MGSREPVSPNYDRNGDPDGVRSSEMESWLERTDLDLIIMANPLPGIRQEGHD